MSTVTLTCACGKMLRAKALDAGKKCKCVGCGAVLIIPATGAGDAIKPVAPKSVAREKPPISRPVVVNKPTLAFPERARETAVEQSLDPESLGDLLSDLAIGPVDVSPVFEMSMTPEPEGLPRARPIALGKAQPSSVPDVRDTLAARSVLKSRQRPDATGRGSSFHIDWKYPTLAVALLLVVGLVFFIKLGPMQARDEWAVAQEAGDNVTQSVIGKALQAYLATNGGWTPGDSHYMPSVKSVAWFEPPFMLRMPDQMEVHGRTSHGKFQGFYGTRDGEIQADVDIFSTRIRVTGRIDKDGKIIAEVNGKGVEVPAVVQRDRQDLR